jgi:hypothetical protein
MTQKWNLQDIRPAPQRQRGPAADRPGHEINRIRPSSSVRPADTPFDSSEDTEDNHIPVINGTKRSHSQLIIGLIIAGLVIGGGLAISALTGGAEVTIYPKVRELNVNAEFTAFTEKKAGELSYEIMTLDATGERQVKASGQETVTKQATGEIEISKSTAGAERLIKNTRFQTADGLIFRIQESVVVPGAITDSSGKSVPGVTRAQVFADEVGEKYNLAANTLLSVPGFKEGGYTDLYNAISAKNTQAFVDGFNGPRFIINETELSTARQSLQLELRNALLARVTSERPADFTSFETGIAITYTALPPSQYGDDLVTIKEQAILQVPLFKNQDFANFIAKETIVGYEGEPVRIDNLQNLTFTYVSATTSQSNIANLPALTFKIAGVPKIVWTFDAEKMKVDLLGMEKTAFNGVLSQYSGIERGEVAVRPFWKRTFPMELSDITITEDLSTPK